MMAPSADDPAVHGLARGRSLDAANAGARGLSWTTVLLRAYAAALREVPELLCRWEDDRATDARAARASPWPWPPTAGLLVPIFVEPDLRRPARAGRRDARRSSARPTPASSTAPTWASPTARCPTSAALGVDRFQALLTPPQASVLSLGVDPASGPVAVPGRRGARPDRRTPASPSTTGWPTARTPRSCSTSFATRLGGPL